MTDSELNKALAQALYPNAEIRREDGRMYFYNPEYPQIMQWLPDYAGDLNACHAVEMGLPEEAYSRFLTTLEDIVEATDEYSGMICSAPARARAEALLFNLTGFYHWEEQP